MKVTLKLNRVGMTMEEATLVAWLVKPGEVFSKDDVLYEIETEKVTQEVTAPVSGKLLEILVEEDAELVVGDEVCVIESDEAVVDADDAS
jgi:pyruvate/2-oxoglutarate dehydrogenase complex dihydrolipoamide acyltransferase (E2) component